MCDNSPSSPALLEQINTDELLNSNMMETRYLEIDSETLERNLSFLDFDSQSQSQTISMSQSHYVSLPAHLQQLPEVEDMKDNDWNFDVLLKAESNSKSSWLFSPPLNKVFVKMNTPMNVYPSFNNKGNAMDQFNIRAMIVYSSPHDLPVPVNKCPNHKQGQEQLVDHILRCTNNGATYIGHSNGKLFAEKLAMYINMGYVAANEPLTLQFTCQNSCSGGINRRLTSLVFTLEDGAQNILGRKVMHFKVCSCPRRDKEKDESTTKVLPKKRKAEAGSLPSTSTKRMHLSKQDSDSVLVDANTDTALPSIKIESEDPCELKVMLPNERLKKNVLRIIYDSVAGEISRTGNTAYNCYLQEIQKQIGK